MKNLSMVALLGLLACAGMSLNQRQTLIADVVDTVSVAAPLVGQDGQPYLDAVKAVLVAAAEDGEADWAMLFTAVREAEPVARKSLIEAGRSAVEAEAVLALIRMALRRLEQAVLAPAG